MVKQIDILEGKTKDIDPLLDALFESNKNDLFISKGLSWKNLAMTNQEMRKRLTFKIWLFL